MILRRAAPLNRASPRRNSMRKPRMLTLFAIAFALAQVSLASAQTKSIVVASTTSTEDSGLFGFILPLFRQKTGIDVKVVAHGTGQALDMARRAMPTSYWCMRGKRRRNLLQK